MTLGEFATLLGTDPKWVQNAATALGGGLTFTLSRARRLAVARALSDATDAPLSRSWELAGPVLRKFDGSSTPVTISSPRDNAVTLTIDVYRILAQVSTRLSWLRTEYQPRRRGRPVTRRDPLTAAEEYGVDLGLLRFNLERTPAERLRQLDAMADFRRGARRV